jgi:hypothetical protein
VDVAAILDNTASENTQKLDWKQATQGSVIKKLAENGGKVPKELLAA